VLALAFYIKTLKPEGGGYSKIIASFALSRETSELLY